jgi:hypothetical protein
MSEQRRSRIHDANWALRRLSSKAAMIPDIAPRHPLGMWSDANWKPLRDWTHARRSSGSATSSGTD